MLYDTYSKSRGRMAAITPEVHCETDTCGLKPRRENYRLTQSALTTVRVLTPQPYEIGSLKILFK